MRVFLPMEDPMSVRLLQLAALVLLALVAAGAARGTPEPPIPATLTVEPFGGRFTNDPVRLAVVVDLVGEKAGPGRISIHAPQQFWLEPERAEGSPVGHAEIYLRNRLGPPLRYAGTVAAAPLAAASAGCSPDELTGAWMIRAFRGGKRLQLPIGIAEVDGTTRLDLCPSTQHSVAAVSLSLVDIHAPRARGSYAWRAFVTPRFDTGATYELRSIVPVPHVLTLHGGYRSKSQRAVLTGLLLANGKPRQRAKIDIVRLERTAVPLAFYDSWDAIVRTTEQGTYSLALPLVRTQGFIASTPRTVKLCIGPSTAPAGCKSTTFAGTQSDPITVTVP
jgi:hypothetical protein